MGEGARYGDGAVRRFVVVTRARHPFAQASAHKRGRETKRMKFYYSGFVDELRKPMEGRRQERTQAA